MASPVFHVCVLRSRHAAADLGAAFDKEVSADFEQRLQRKLWP